MTFRPLLVLSSGLFLSACAVGPDFESRGLGELFGLADPTGYQFRDGATSASRQTQPMSHWWERLGDPSLAPLISEMLDRNYDLAASAARTQEAQAQLDAAFGGRLPSLSASPSANRAFTTDPAGNRTYTNSFSVGATLSWQIDLFGRLARSQRAAAANYEASQADEQGLIHTQIATLVRTRVAIATLTRRIASAEAIAESRRTTLAAVDRRYRSGLSDTSATDLHSARENLSSALADIPALKADLFAATTALDILLGRLPGTSTLDASTLAVVPPPRDVPVGLPADLLDRRPDLRSAEFRVAAATENVGVAIADLYPNLTLTGTLSSTSPRAGSLFDVATLAGSLAGQLTQSVFDGGTRSAVVRQREAALTQQAASYASAILTAIKEVEDALEAERQSETRLTHLEAALNEARLAEASAADRYQRGIGNFQTLLEVQRRLQNLEQGLLIEQQNKWNSRITLLLALGGDWLGATPRLAHLNLTDPTL